MSIDQLIRDSLNTLVVPVDADAVITTLNERHRRHLRRVRIRYAWTAAALLVAVTFGFSAIRLDVSTNDDIATGPDATDGPATGSGVEFTVLWSGDAGDEPSGALRSATDSAELTSLWIAALSVPPAIKPVLPAVDFDREVVASITVADQPCPLALTGMDRDPSTGPPTISPVFAQPAEACTGPPASTTFVVAIDWASLGQEFQLLLDKPIGNGSTESVLTVTRPG